MKILTLNLHCFAEDDIIFNYPSYGSIVNKEAGNIYSGGLFVCKLKNFTNAYDIIPSKMPLDRDRCVPQSFDVNYYSSYTCAAIAVWHHPGLRSRLKVSI